VWESAEITRYLRFVAIGHVLAAALVVRKCKTRADGGKALPQTLKLVDRRPDRVVRDVRGLP
jgi:hypothetical protein